MAVATESKDFKLAKQLLESLKYKHLHPEADYDNNGLSYQKYVYKYARRFLPQKFNQLFPISRDPDSKLYTDYIFRKYTARDDSDLNVYLNPETVPHETEQFHQEVEKASEASKRDFRDEQRAKAAKSKQEEGRSLGGGEGSSLKPLEETRPETAIEQPATKPTELPTPGVVFTPGEQAKLDQLKARVDESKKLRRAFEETKQKGVPEPVKEAGNNLQITAKKMIAKLNWRIVLGGFIGGGAGSVVGGAPGAAIGAVSGGAIVYNRINNSEPEAANSEVNNNRRGSSPVFSAGKQLVGKAAKQAGKQAAKKVAAQVGQKLAVAAATQPEFWIVLGIILLILLIVIIGPQLLEMTSLCLPNSQCGSTATSTTTPGTSSTITLTKAGPAAVPNCDASGNCPDIHYNIAATNSGTSPADVDITDQIPPNTVCKSVTGGATCGTTVSWHIAALAANTSQTVDLTVTITPAANDSYITNVVNGNSTGGSGSNTPPNTDSCNGSYNIQNNPLGNFGDPTCNFKKTDLYNSLSSADSTNADYWFNVVIPCESGYNPDAYNPAAVDSAGAWGLTQMGRGKNGQYDHGDVNWPQQVTNSVTYQQQIGNWRYWACAKSRW